jgi:hypothetical protein
MVLNQPFRPGSSGGAALLEKPQQSPESKKAWSLGIALPESVGIFIYLCYLVEDI